MSWDWDNLGIFHLEKSSSKASFAEGFRKAQIRYSYGCDVLRSVAGIM